MSWEQLHGIMDPFFKIIFILETTFPKHGATVLIIPMTFAKLINVEATSRQENVPPQIFI